MQEKRSQMGNSKSWPSKGFIDPDNKHIYMNLCADRSLIKGSLILLPLLGLTWVFGLFAVNENTAVFAWLFTILNSLQVCWRYSSLNYTTS